MLIEEEETLWQSSSDKEGEDLSLSLSLCKLSFQT